ncbi:very short patch repair endonuclease [Pseudonocardia humida]|uniref:DNA mismatch endonuclease Vsr n=1 Tax=Pseudonocardia humida TaxID=2800819 RepID=A0ABT1A7U2_9PSEU|nr:very short patch repair endonuclease [Pseudonocardia humida]MCO1658904.1 DNA mismatch endonuclease Vsr [Pseudonocardia humida]
MTGARVPPRDRATSRRLGQQRRSGTRPELELRQALWKLGLRYRVDAPLALPKVRRRADVLFLGARIAVFVDGCFWHACPQHGTRPKSNAEWWTDKLDRNVQRDRDTDRLLREAGWVSVRVWEHEDMGCAATVIAAKVRERRP